MSPATRAKYFSQYWPAACAAKGWRAGDQDKRRQVTLECMRLVRGLAVTTSDTRFGPDEITALFCYLDHLAHPADLDRAARWVDCQTDYRAFNRARQADYHEAATYGGAGSKRLRKQRFGGAQSAAGEPLEKFDPEKIRKRHLTMATRHQAKERKAREAAAGQDLASHAPAHGHAAHGQPACGQPVNGQPAPVEGENPF
jgi:hypothetical protein